MAPDHWIDALPLPGTFVVNIGELLELASNGYLRATVHRVVPSAPGQELPSIAFFLGAQLDAVVPVYPLPEALAREVRGPATDSAQSAAAGGGLELPQGAAAFPP